MKSCDHACRLCSQCFQRSLAWPHCTFWICLPNTQIKENTCCPRSFNHVFVGQPSPSQWCVERLLLWPFCVLQSGAEEQTQSVVVLWWDHKRRRCSLWLSCLSFAMFCCMFLVLFTACFNNWHRVNRASFGLLVSGIKSTHALQCPSFAMHRY